MILVVNTGSSSIKVAVFKNDSDQNPNSRISGQVDGIGSAGHLVIGQHRTPTDTADHAAALNLILDALQARGVGTARLVAAAHRIVHGADMTAPVRLTAQTIARIETVTPLAPLHNPQALAAIRALEARSPDLPQYASFDTAFHATNPSPDRSLRLGGMPQCGGSILQFLPAILACDSMPDGAKLPRRSF